MLFIPRSLAVELRICEVELSAAATRQPSRIREVLRACTVEVPSRSTAAFKLVPTMLPTTGSLRVQSMSS
jgi:hypothetical protein